MAQPDLSNGNCLLREPIDTADKVSASLWLNIEDPQLRTSLLAYFSNPGADGSPRRPAMQLSVKREGTGYHKVASFNLFVNDASKQRPASGNLDDDIPF